MFRSPRRLMLPIDSDAAPALWNAGICSEADVWRWYCGGVDVHRPSNGVFVDFFGHADGCLNLCPPPPTHLKVNISTCCIALYCWKGAESFFISDFEFLNLFILIMPLFCKSCLYLLLWDEFVLGLALLAATVTNTGPTMKSHNPHPAGWEKEKNGLWFNTHLQFQCGECPQISQPV